MASVFLSPSTQEYNITTTGNSEEYYANLITDAMIPYLNASNISYGRNDPDGNVNTSIAMSNAGNYDLHVAIHSNAAPEHLSGILRGSDVYYYRDSARGKAAAEILQIILNWFIRIRPMSPQCLIRRWPSSAEPELPPFFWNWLIMIIPRTLSGW